MLMQAVAGKKSVAFILNVRCWKKEAYCVSNVSVFDHSSVRFLKLRKSILLAFWFFGFFFCKPLGVW